MAQTGYTPILIYSSSTAAASPVAGNLTNSTLGSELAINITDGKLFYKDNANAVQVIAWKTTPTTAGGTGLTSYTAGDLLYYATGTTLTKLAIGAAGTWFGSSGSAPQWNTPAALTKTDDTNVTLTLGGNPSTALLNATSLTLGWTGTLATSRGGTGLSSFTANGVVYASSTSALATSSNLTYSTDFTVTGGNLTSVKTSGAPAAFIHSNQGAGAFSPTVQFYRTGASSTATPNNQTVGTIRWDGLDSNAAFANFGYIALDTFTNAAGGAPSAMTFATAASGANATERMRIFASGGISIGNTTDPGATNLSVTGRTVSALFRTDSGQINPASGVTTTIFTCPTLDNGCYIVTCNIPGQAPPTYSAVGVVLVGGTTLNFTSLAAATLLTISVTGQNIQVVQNSGGTNSVDWTVTRIS